ncbi:PH domain-containing protein [Candidatus Parcubacteria bacterium]|nr:PH domain-containing protein [Candidatus Parcubacteria bacterium]
MLSKYQLPNQLPKEKILKIIRKDIFILIKKVALFILLTILPLALFFVIAISQPQFFNGKMSYPLMVLGASAYYLFIWLFFFFSFIDYYLDVWIITTERIIDIEQKGFFSRVISEHKLFRIQDVTSEVHGVFPTILRYGEVYVQTAGTRQRFNFRQIPNPNKIRDMIIKLVERKKKEVQNEEKNNS